MSVKNPLGELPPENAPERGDQNIRKSIEEGNASTGGDVPEDVGDKKLSKKEFESMKSVAQEKDIKDMAVARAELGLTPEHDEHEHSHEETQEQRDKMADEIIGRTEGIKGKTSETAKKLAEEVRRNGESAIEGIRVDFANLAEKGMTKDFEKLYPGWKKADFETLYHSLYGEDVNDNAKKRRENGEKIRRMQQEAEFRKQQEEQLRVAKAEKNSVENRSQQPQKRKSWLGRLFGGK